MNEMQDDFWHRNFETWKYWRVKVHSKEKWYGGVGGGKSINKGLNN